MLPTDFSPRFAATCTDAAARCYAWIGENILLPALPEHAASPQPATPSFSLPQADALISALGQPEADYLIGDRAGQACRLLFWPQGDAPDGYALHNLRAVHGSLDEGDFWIAARARQLVSWDREHRFCGYCGTATFPAPNEVARVCPNCHQRHYARVSPAIMVLIKRGRQLLLARSPHFKAGMYSALAGFVEPGEACEGTVHREVMEEVNLRVKNLRWFDSQSWPFPHSLMLAFIADYDGGDIVCQPEEIEDAQWFDIDALPDLPTRASIARRLIEHVVSEMRAA
ncbi:NAD(+) diphosphatase [Amantichitinum ursilacus]|uniref:NAD(+) diphosphatase n=1 Tax=Amantichitinum ursilacus TaxID=857265 RepID=A0A0N0XI67_9NEIS|nr:NAD(+) diphosphatase [Amantichitinum ursilacus]KPC52315.1 NADH pyrophosphatase [Amantichitinum ursilacus]